MRILKMTKRIARREEAFLPLLSDTARKVFKELREHQSVPSLNPLRAFATGFKLGTRIIHEVMEADSNE